MVCCPFNAWLQSSCWTVEIGQWKAVVCSTHLHTFFVEFFFPLSIILAITEGAQTFIFNRANVGRIEQSFSRGTSLMTSAAASQIAPWPFRLQLGDYLKRLESFLHATESSLPDLPTPSLSRTARLRLAPAATKKNKTQRPGIATTHCPFRFHPVASRETTSQTSRQASSADQLTRSRSC